MRRFLLVPILAAISLLLSSCFQLVAFRFSPDSVRQGGSTWAYLAVRPVDARIHQIQYFVILVAVPTINEVTAGTTVFDLTGKYGGPTAMVSDNTLKNYMLASRRCQGNGLNASDITDVNWVAFRTPTQIDDRGETGTTVLNRSKVNATSDAFTDRVHSIAYGIGFWGDDGDGIPEDTDTISCTSIFYGGLLVTSG